MSRVTLIGVCLAVVLFQQCLGCTPTFAARARVCMKDLVPPRGALPIPGGGSYEWLTRVCRPNKPKAAFDCMANLLKSCNATFRANVAKYVDLQKMKEAWSQLCERRDQYGRHVQCYRNQRRKIYQCLDLTRRAFASKTKEGACKSKSQSYRIDCKIYAFTANCLEKAVERCSGIAGKIIKDFYMKTRYPVCSRYDTDRRKRSRVEDQVTVDEVQKILFTTNSLLNII